MKRSTSKTEEVGCRFESCLPDLNGYQNPSIPVKSIDLQGFIFAPTSNQIKKQHFSGETFGEYNQARPLYSPNASQFIISQTITSIFFDVF